ncbi:MAG: Holliday junction branch migration protein RuvA [Candidatus Sungbacteria bacterium]|uniref:Holliday junction branch migration complex subunit RuvA n=1 Tax=Candidatus Sungiibacteriota bacterium TaxID=2750080 RepID=A0A932YYE4_9BACT|nr:Holliday junction branch migration protein RuvA [Candidatus Sungbacteria bacterium]
MIVLLDGTIELKGEKFVAIAANGVGYRVFATAETIRKIPEKGQKIKLWTHLYQREDTIELYGFLHFAELEFFETLIQLPGIGPKSGLGIMAVAPLDTLKKAIAAGDTSYLTKVSGIGRKTAEKVILELREKLAGQGVTISDVPELREESDALEALIALGYTQSEARSALAAIPREIKGARERVQEALRRLGNHRRNQA